MKTIYNEFCGVLDSCLKSTLDKNIIIYGCQGGDFVSWFYKNYYGKEIKAMVDRWALSPISTILHLWSLYYIYDENDIIINTTSKNIKNEFNDTGEDWERLKYQEKQIINLWDMIYDSAVMENRLEPEITYFDWLEYKYDIDLLTTIKRKFVTGMHAHGYYPTDFRIFSEGTSKFDIKEEDAVLDIGSGKGSAVIALSACGFKHIGAVEYTEDIYRTLVSNLNKMGISTTEYSVGSDAKVEIGSVNCYLGDASLMEAQLDNYNWFFLFNPFSWEIVQKVLKNICNSLKRKPRKINIFYAEPIGHHLIMDTGMFRVKAKICSDLSNVSYYSYIYEAIQAKGDN